MSGFSKTIFEWCAAMSPIILAPSRPSRASLKLFESVLKFLHTLILSFSPVLA